MPSNSQILLFTAPDEVQVVQKMLPEPGAGQVLVKTQLSGISAGTEMLIYGGHFPDQMRVDSSIPALAGEFRYPLQYGYAAVGEVVGLGAGVDAIWEGIQVFSFQPHQSHFLAAPEDLMPLPEGVTAEQAVFLPNMETAVNFLMDGKPLLGEDVLVFGQGVVGLLSTAILSRLFLRTLVTLDLYPLRRKKSLELGAFAALDPAAAGCQKTLREFFPHGADLTFELSGSTQALDDAIAATGFSGRVIIGSWYGSKRASLNLGGDFHRSRIALISSQVSTIAPDLSGRWTKPRRFNLAWDLIQRLQPARLITHRFPFEQAAQAYELLAHHPEQALQVVLTYPA